MKLINRRLGFTMQEILVAISVSAALMVIAVGWLHQTMKFSSAMNGRLRHHQSLTRLAAELRNDVQNSSSLAIDDDNRLRLVWGNGTQITYTISDTSSVIQKQRKHPTRETTVIRDTFALSTHSTASWDTSEMPDWISLVVTRGCEGVPLSQPAQQSRDSSLAPVGARVMPVDLHVRVGANRWSTALTETISPNDKEPK